MPLTIVTPRASQPVTLAEAKLHLRVDSSAEDALISALIIAATDDAEHLMQRAVLPQTRQLTLDSFAAASADALTSMSTTAAASSEIALPCPPVTAISSVKYLRDTDGTLITLDPSAYVLAAASDYSARLVPAYGTTWPATRAMPEAVRIAFVTGYADAASVPELIKAWIKLQVGAMYENREAEGAVQTYALGFADRLLDRYKVWSV